MKRSLTELEPTSPSLSSSSPNICFRSNYVTILQPSNSFSNIMFRSGFAIILSSFFCLWDLLRKLAFFSKFTIPIISFLNKLINYYIKFRLIEFKLFPLMWIIITSHRSTPYVCATDVINKLYKKGMYYNINSVINKQNYLHVLFD